MVEWMHVLGFHITVIPSLEYAGIVQFVNLLLILKLPCKKSR